MYYQCFLLCIAGLPIANQCRHPNSKISNIPGKKIYFQFAYRAASNFLQRSRVANQCQRGETNYSTFFSQRGDSAVGCDSVWIMLFFYFIKASFLRWGRVVILLLLPFLNQPTLVATCLLSLIIVWAHKCLSFKWYSRLLSSVSARIIGVVINIHRFYSRAV